MLFSTSRSSPGPTAQPCLCLSGKDRLISHGLLPPSSLSYHMTCLVILCFSSLLNLVAFASFSLSPSLNEMCLLWHQQWNEEVNSPHLLNRGVRLLGLRASMGLVVDYTKSNLWTANLYYRSKLKKATDQPCSLHSFKRLIHRLYVLLYWAVETYLHFYTAETRRLKWIHLTSTKVPI